VIVHLTLREALIVSHAIHWAGVHGDFDEKQVRVLDDVGQSIIDAVDQENLSRAPG